MSRTSASKGWNSFAVLKDRRVGRLAGSSALTWSFSQVPPEQWFWFVGIWNGTVDCGLKYTYSSQINFPTLGRLSGSNFPPYFVFHWDSTLPPTNLDYDCMVCGHVFCILNIAPNAFFETFLMLSACPISVAWNPFAEIPFCHVSPWSLKSLKGFWPSSFYAKLCPAYHLPSL